MILEWSTRWAVPPAAIQELLALLSADATALLTPERNPKAKSEAAVSSVVRREAFSHNVLLFRNNVGALLDTRGVPVRFGLANDSKALNKSIKSADLIGIRRYVVQEADVGHTLGLFCSRETKHADWRQGEDLVREKAQVAWRDLVLAWGGDAAIVTGPGSFAPPL